DIESDLFGSMVQVKNSRTGRISGDRYLAQSHHPFAEISEDRNEHREIFAYFTLRDFHAHFYVRTTRWVYVIFHPIARDFCAVHPFGEKPIQTSILLQVH